jgi:ribosome maturation factor RimP
VTGEEVVMNGSSRRTEARPERQRAHARPEELATLLEPVVTEAGLELESVRIGRAGPRRVLRVVVDGENGVDLDDVARVSRAVAAEVDGRDAMGPGAYTLEVSSPGVDRPLTEPRHWRRAAGRLVRVGVGERVIEGRVITAGPDGVTFDIDGDHSELGYADLGPGKIQVEFGGSYGDLGGPASGGGDREAPRGQGGKSDGH